MNSLDNSDFLDDYINGYLHDEEQKKFASLEQNDPAFAEIVKTHKSTLAGIQKSNQNELLKMLQNIHYELEINADILTDENFDEYIQGNFDADESKKIEALISEQGAEEELKEKKKLIAGIKQSGKNELLAQLKSIHQEVVKEPVRGKVLPMFFNKYAAAASVLVFVVIALYFYVNNGSGSQELYAAYYQTYSDDLSTHIEAELSSSGFENQDELKEQFKIAETALKLFRNKAFVSAFVQFSNIDYDIILPFYHWSLKLHTAICQLEIGESHSSVAALQKILNDSALNSSQLQTTQWFLALAYLKTGEVEIATEILQKVLPNSKDKKIEELLQEINLKGKVSKTELNIKTPPISTKNNEYQYNIDSFNYKQKELSLLNRIKNLESTLLIKKEGNTDSLSKVIKDLKRKLTIASDEFSYILSNHLLTIQLEESNNELKKQKEKLAQLQKQKETVVITQLEEELEKLEKQLDNSSKARNRLETELKTQSELNNANKLFSSALKQIEVASSTKEGNDAALNLLITAWENCEKSYEVLCRLKLSNAIDESVKMEEVVKIMSRIKNNSKIKNYKNFKNYFSRKNLPNLC